jgi:hypothetical protein
VTYQAIHAALVEGGLNITFGYYETARLRVRAKAAHLSKDVGSAEPEASGPREPIVKLENDPPGMDSPTAQPELTVRAGDAFAVRNALKRAQEISKVDYRKFAKIKS